MTNISKTVAGAVKSALDAHPDYATPKGRDNLAASISKRLIGQLKSSA